MIRRLPIALFCLVSCLQTSALAQEEPGDEALPTEEPRAEAGEDDSWWWFRFIDKEIEKVSGMDLYGVTSQLPEGYLSVKWDWATIKAGKRYNDKRELGPAMPPIEFTEGDQKILSIDMGLEGHGGGHTFQVSYGIIDDLDWYIEFPFTYMHVSFNPKINDIDDDGNKVAPGLYAGLLGISDPKTYSACEFMDNTLPMLGRPAPAIKYDGDWLLGDINTGFSWNIYRTPRFSVALTPRVFLPTGHIPDPENNLLYGTGPELETGVGGWAAGFTQGYDVRLFKYSYWIDIIASTEFTASYAFPQDRAYPDNFVKPNELAMKLDPAAFPDLSGLEGNFEYRPGWSMEWTVQLQVQLAILGLGVGYGISHTQEPELNGDPNFLQMARSLELLGAQSMEMIQLAASINLLALYIPVDIAFQWRKVIDGYNAIIFDDYYQITVKAYLPLFLLWD